MNELLRRLLELGEVDLQRVELERQMGRYPIMMREMEEKEAMLRQQIEAARRRLDDSRHHQREADREIKALHAKLEHYTRQQGSVGSAREYEALTHEIELGQARIAEQENIALENMEREEAAQDEIARIENKLALTQQEHDIERARIERQQTEKYARVASLNGEYDDLYARLPDDWREDFDLVRSRHPGATCSAIENGHCSGCGRTLVAHIVQLALRGEARLQCENCRRFLYDPAVKP